MLRPFIFALTLISSVGALACSCIPETWTSGSDARAQAGAVFIGVPSSDSATFGTMARTTFAVIGNLKNVPYKTVRVWSEIPDGGNCGVSFKRDGGAYVLLAGFRNGRYTVNVCGIQGLSSTSATFLRELKGVR